MLDKNFQRRYFPQDGVNSARIYQYARGLLLLLQTIMGLLVTIKKLWDNGFGQELELVEGNDTLINNATKRWWKMAQAQFLVYGIFMNMPLSMLASLSMPDGEGGTVNPFAVYDPEILGNLASYSLEQVAFREPEIQGEEI